MVTRERILEALERGWGTYVATFDALPPDVQRQCLDRQGYRRFADLLAHVIAWWREGRAIVEALLADPGYQAPARDVDAFNAAAVRTVLAEDEAAVRQAFEVARRDLVTYVANLPESAVETEKIVAQLNMEIIGHLAEHSLAEY